jgi:two-component system OmpR family response regulator
VDLAVQTDAAAMSVPRILLVEDDQHVGETMRRNVERSGMPVCWARSGAEAVEMKGSFSPDVALVDLELPDVNGVDLIRWLVGQQDCGVIVVSGAGDETDRIVGLELGADDYVAKPPNMRELIARIRAVHRRTSQRSKGQETASAAIAIGEIRLDMARRTVTGKDGNRIALTGAEYAALETLARAQGKVVTRDELSKEALRRPWQPEDRSVDQLVLSLRQKLGPDATGQSPIESIRGSGYLLRQAQ